MTAVCVFKIQTEALSWFKDILGDFSGVSLFFLKDVFSSVRNVFSLLISSVSCQMFFFFFFCCSVVKSETVRCCHLVAASGLSGEQLHEVFNDIMLFYKS